MNKIRSFYDIVKIESDRVFIIDLNLPHSRSVTNDAENVYNEIKSLWPYKRLIYRDSMNKWDEILCDKHSIFFRSYQDPAPVI